MTKVIHSFLIGYDCCYFHGITFLSSHLSCILTIFALKLFSVLYTFYEYDVTIWVCEIEFFVFRLWRTVAVFLRMISKQRKGNAAAYIHCIIFVYIFSWITQYLVFCIWMFFQNIDRSTVMDVKPMDYKSKPETRMLGFALMYINVVFTVLFTIECMLKLLAFGVKVCEMVSVATYSHMTWASWVGGRLSFLVKISIIYMHEIRQINYNVVILMKSNARNCYLKT